MASRAYRRDSQGRFAGSGGGAMVTYGKAGGFANAAFRARSGSTNQKATKGRSFGIGQVGRRAGKAAIRSQTNLGPAARRARNRGLVKIGIGVAGGALSAKLSQSKNDGALLTAIGVSVVAGKVTGSGFADAVMPRSTAKMKAVRTSKQKQKRAARAGQARFS